MTIGLSFVGSNDSSDLEEHMDVLSRNHTRTEHSDDDDQYTEVKVAIAEVDFDKFERLQIVSTKILWLMFDKFLKP